MRTGRRGRAQSGVHLPWLARTRDVGAGGVAPVSGSGARWSGGLPQEIAELVCEGPRAAARLWYTGTHTGMVVGLPATQRRSGYAGAAFFTADSRWLTSAWVLDDLDGLHSQLA